MAIFLGTEGEQRSELEAAAALLRHMVCLGSSGSGKTVAAKVVCEEMARAVAPVIAIDEAIALAERTYPITAEHALVFLPYWRFPMPGDSRELLIDGVLGKPGRFAG